MSRRLEVTVPNLWSPPVRSILETECGLSPKSGKAYMMTEVSGIENTIFMIVIPGPAVSGILEALRRNGIGSSVGRIMLTTIDYLKPDLNAPLVKPQLTIEQMQEEAKKPAPLKSFQHFKKARKTTEEMYNEISNNANTTINTWMNLIGASTMAAGGLTTNVLVFTVAAMLVSPIMGPILGMVMGYRVADFKLFRTGFLNEFKMAIVTYLTGCFYGTLLGDVSKTYKWPNSQMMHEGMAFNLVISIIVSAAAGMVLGISLTAAGGNALVGTAISAGLLPPLVNAGMLHAYATFYVYESERKSLFYEIGTYSVLFYATHVITIVIVANFVFYLKDVDPRFREGEDSNIQLLTDHRKTLTEREKAEMFIGNIKDDLKKDVKHFTEGVKDFFTGNITLGREGIVNRRTGETSLSKRRQQQQQQRNGGGYSQEYESIREEEEEREDEEYGYKQDDRDEENPTSYNNRRSTNNSNSYKNNDNNYRGSNNNSSRKQKKIVVDDDGDTQEDVTENPMFAHTNNTTTRNKNVLASSSMVRDEETGTAADADFFHVESPPSTSSAVSKKNVSSGAVEMTTTTTTPSYMTKTAAAATPAVVTTPTKTSSSSSSPSPVRMNSSNSTNNNNRNAAKEQVIEFYRRYNPSKLATVDDILVKYQGKEEELLRKLQKQYNVA